MMFKLTVVLLLALQGIQSARLPTKSKPSFAASSPSGTKSGAASNIKSPSFTSPVVRQQQHRQQSQPQEHHQDVEQKQQGSGSSGSFSNLLDEVPMPYSFGYDVADEAGTQLTREEVKDASGIVKGSYSYKDADGLFRTVEYKADSTGFYPTVRSNEPGLSRAGDVNPADVFLDMSATPEAVLQRIANMQYPVQSKISSPHHSRELQRLESVHNKVEDKSLHDENRVLQEQNRKLEDTLAETSTVNRQLNHELDNLKKSLQENKALIDSLTTQLNGLVAKAGSDNRQNENNLHFKESSDNFHVHQKPDESKKEVSKASPSQVIRKEVSKASPSQVIRKEISKASPSQVIRKEVSKTSPSREIPRLQPIEQEQIKEEDKQQKTEDFKS